MPTFSIDPAMYYAHLTHRLYQIKPYEILDQFIFRVFNDNRSTRVVHANNFKISKNYNS